MPHYVPSFPLSAPCEFPFAFRIPSVLTHTFILKACLVSAKAIHATSGADDAPHAGEQSRVSEKVT